jgi:glutaconate CoA-transferase subunit A
MNDKRLPLEAAAALVTNGHTVGLGGMTIYRRPVAFARALIRRATPPRDLTLLGFTGGLAADMLVAAGLVSHTRFCYFGLETFGLAPAFTRAVQEQTVTVIEETEASIACGLRAAMARVGFMPSRAWQGTELFKVRPDVQVITDPYTGESVTAFPAISCDVAVIHVLRADNQGNGMLGGNPTIDAELATVAPVVILTAEEVVDQLPGPIDIPGLVTTAVVEAPNGAWPTSCFPRYPIDGEAILDYVDAVNKGGLAQFLTRETTT